MSAGFVLVGSALHFIYDNRPEIHDQQKYWEDLPVNYKSKSCVCVCSTPIQRLLVVSRRSPAVSLTVCHLNSAPLEISSVQLPAVDRQWWLVLRSTCVVGATAPCQPARFFSTVPLHTPQPRHTARVLRKICVFLSQGVVHILSKARTGQNHPERKLFLRLTLQAQPGAHCFRPGWIRRLEPQQWPIKV